MHATQTQYDDTHTLAQTSACARNQRKAHCQVHERMQHFIAQSHGRCQQVVLDPCLEMESNPKCARGNHCARLAPAHLLQLHHKLSIEERHVLATQEARPLDTKQGQTLAHQLTMKRELSGPNLASVPPKPDHIQLAQRDRAKPWRPGMMAW